MPHSERISRKYFRRTAPCAALGCADSGATALDGRLARKPKYEKISRMESVCHGAAIRRRGALGDCVWAAGAGVSVMRSPRIQEHTDRYARAREKLQDFFDRRDGSTRYRVLLSTAKDLSSISSASDAHDRRANPACGKQGSSLRSSGLRPKLFLASADC